MNYQTFAPSLVVLASSVFASLWGADKQLPPGGCGPNEITFKVNTEKHAQRPGPVGADQALVFVIQDDNMFMTRPRPTVRVGLDGEWVGANHGNSWFNFYVEPGDHQLCASWQAYFPLKTGSRSAAARLSAEAGRVYFFRVRDYYASDSSGMIIQPPSVELEPLDEDEGALLTSRYPLSKAQPNARH